MYATARTVHLSHDEHFLEPILRRVLVVVAALAIAAYIYCVSASVVHIIARKDAEVALARTSSSVALLESKYFDLSSKVTREHATDLGLVPIDDARFIARTVRTAQASVSDAL